MRNYLLLICTLISFNLNAQDIISGGDNKWIFHTPDDGRQDLYIAPDIEGKNAWDRQTIFRESGNILMSGILQLKSLSISSYNSIASVNGFLNLIEFTGGGHGAIVFHPGKEDELMFGMHSNGNFYWGTGRNATKPNYYGMYLNGSEGNLGIKGKLVAEEVKVDSDGWSDFVFEEGYNLPTLQEVEKHIQEKGHLKDIPSAKEVEKNGIFLGEMDAKLLQKIEELTLYAIEQNKRIKVLEAKLDNNNDE